MEPPLVVMLGHLLVSGLSVFIVAKLMPGMRVKSFGSALVFAVMIAILNAIAWHFLAPLTVTLAVLTLGIGALIVNGILFLIAGKISGVEFSGCIVAALASLFVTLVNWALDYVLTGWHRVH